MRTANWITLYAGLMVVGGYVIGSAVRTSLSSRAEGHEALRVAIVEAATVLIWAQLAYRLIDRVAPGTDEFREFSAVGILAPRALTVWEAVALWAGLAVVCGLIVPFSRGFRPGSSGLSSAGALMITFSPVTFFAVLFTWSGAHALLSPRAALLTAFFAAAGVEWLQSMVSTSVAPQAWGFVHGPETVLWVAVMGGALAARLSHQEDARQ